MRRDEALAAAVFAIGLASVPSHDSFLEYLHASRSRVSGWADAWSALRSEISIPLLAESDRYVVLRLGRYDGRRFLGCYGCWLPLPSLDLGLSDPLRLCASWLCLSDASGVSWGPHEAFALLCALIFVLWQLAPPGFMWRHFTTSPSTVRAGRVWTLLTAAVSHCEVVHLSYNLISLLGVGPDLAARVPCRDLAELMLASAVASSAVSLLWSALDRRRRDAPSLGASGVVLALFVASATLSPDRPCVLYGMVLPASHAVLVQCGLDCMLAAMGAHGRRAAGSGEIDVAAHLGGALCGYWYARHRWRGQWRFLAGRPGF
jgi:membrane associated rhomboid family serine protease